MNLSDPRKVIEGVFGGAFEPHVVDLRGAYLDRLDTEGPGFLEVHLAGLPRKVGRGLVQAGVTTFAGGIVDLSAWRVCDLLAADLLLRVPEGGGLVEQLYFQGDAEERRMILRSLPFRAPSPEVLRLMEEAHRTNDEVIFESGNLDSDLAARALDAAAFNRVVLKCAFLEEPKERLFGWEGRGNDALSMMLFDFVCEREAAGRPAWPDTAALCRLAPQSLRHRAKEEGDPALRASLQRLLDAI